ncbi:MAG: hypothetical protein HZC55_26615 [Verrucomicrobia bacterium]|nr:hypothetical protein [Verrucomicrobiota bacterium]
MIFAAPLPFTEALQSREVRSILLTTGQTADLERLAPAIRERAIFSATVTSAEFLDRVDRGVSELLAAKSDQATVRLGLKQLLQEMGYTAAPEKAGGLEDLRSDARLNLILETNIELARGYGQWIQGQQADVLDEWPAQELVREREAAVPRDWAARWADAGGQFYGGRMVALKTDPIWRRLSRFELPYPPFDFNSGMGVADLARDEAEALGLLEPNTELIPQDRDFAADLKVSPAVRTNRLIDALEASGVGEFNDAGVFVFRSGLGGFA